MLTDKTIMITGGTGSFGKAFIEKLLELDHSGKIVVFSRDEKKQYDMRKYFSNSKIKFIIGDTRDRERVFEAMQGVDYLFHAAALKHVPTCEFFPLEATKTNVLGSANVLDAAEQCNVKKVVVLSTDKAVYPLNAMGMTKGLMEKLMIAKSRTSYSDTVYCAIRYGNVMYSRGSVIPLFVEQIKAGKPVTITYPDMTRFLLPLTVAVELVLFALENANSGDLFVRKAPASTIQDLAQACLNVFEAKNEIETIGIREGEKIHETLVNHEELITAEEFPDYYRIRPDMKMDYEDYFNKGYADKIEKEGYTSGNTNRLTVADIEKLLISLDEIRGELVNKQ